MGNELHVEEDGVEARMVQMMSLTGDETAAYFESWSISMSCCVFDGRVDRVHLAYAATVAHGCTLPTNARVFPAWAE